MWGIDRLLHLDVVRRGRRSGWWYEGWKGGGDRYGREKRGFWLRCSRHRFLGFWPGFGSDVKRK
jgi:hypothetical protein